MNTNCPACDAPGYVLGLDLFGLYRCSNRRCRAEYYVEWRKCAMCGDIAQEDSDHCDFHTRMCGSSNNWDEALTDEQRAIVDERHICSEPDCHNHVPSGGDYRYCWMHGDANGEHHV
jgi:hypothetical protein